VATPAGWCWAHLGRERQIALVPVELHGAYRHAGGVRGLPNAERGLAVDDPPRRVGVAPGDEVPADVLDDLERLLGYALPPRYRRYLGATNGAGPIAPGALSPYGFLADQPFFGLARADQHQDLSYAPDWLTDRFTPDYLPIGYVQGGVLAVQVTGSAVDSIWYWDDDDPEDLDSFDAEHICANLLHRCADDIDDFWAALAAPYREMLDIADELLAAGDVRVLRPPLAGTGLPVAQRAPWQDRTPGRADPVTDLFTPS
jgi:hypothetical protein